MYVAILLLPLAPASEPQFVVENKMPQFVVENKVPTPSASEYWEWSPYWDGRQWQPRWLPKGGVSRSATPFAGSPTTQTTSATGAVRSSTSSPDSTATGRTTTLAPDAATYGVTDNCPPSG